uniref:Uncharacterized protein n=1 Tax=Syphacia muris TaxID=451379 RepID=A0A0N5AKD3_9BILA
MLQLNTETICSWIYYSLVSINPEDSSAFAAVSLDRAAKA